MKYKYRLAICLIALMSVFCLTEPLMADPLEEGLAAYKRGDFATALLNLKPLAEQGDASAQFGLGLMYFNGSGVPQNNAEAVRWYRKSAEQGSAQAQNNLGEMYNEGRGVPQNYSEAVKWFRSAAEQGYAWAQRNIGSMYYYGRGVPRDLVQAHMWFNLAAVHFTSIDERKEAVALRNSVESEMSSEEIAEAQALATQWKPKAAAGEAPELPLESVDRGLAQSGGAKADAPARPGTGAGETAREGVSILWENPALGREPTFMPKPVIPKWVSEAGLHLTLEFDFLLTPQGVLNGVRLRKSSGYSDVDSAVLEALMRWKFKPVASKAEVKGRVGYLILPR